MKPPDTVLHDPTSEVTPLSRPRRAPLASLDNKTVALFDIGKRRSDEFLDHVQARLETRGVETIRFGKPSNARPATPDVVRRTAEAAHAVVVALAD